MGLLNKAAYPNWHVAALATANPAYVNGPTQGCGCAEQRRVRACTGLRMNASEDALS